MTRWLLHHSRAWVLPAKYARVSIVTTVAIQGRGQSVSRDVERLHARDVQHETTEWRSIG